jgi:hypothetical protein
MYWRLCILHNPVYVQSDNRQQTAVIDYTRLETCQQSFIHMLMWFETQVCPAACFCTCVLALCAFCNNPVHAQVTQQTDSVIDYAG